MKDVKGARGSDRDAAHILRDQRRTDLGSP